MQKKLVFLLLSFTLIGCVDNQASVDKETYPTTLSSVDTGNQEADLPVETETPDEEQYTFDYKGTTISLLDSVEQVQNILGESKESKTVSSAAFVGEQKIFTYDSFRIVTYQGDTQEYIECISFLDGTYKTSEGIAIGDSKESLVQVYGDTLKAVKENIYITTLGETQIRFIILNDKVATIDYYVTLNNEKLEIDEKEPTITNPFDMTVYTDQNAEEIDYFSYTSARDDVDVTTRLVVDASKVDLSTPGDYKVTYYAYDFAGNEAETSVTYTVAEKKANYTEPSKVEALADQVLKNIITEDMTVTEKCTAIYKYMRGNFSYSNSSDKIDWIQAAATGLKRKSGDCFVYYAVAQELLYRSGVESIRVQKNPGHPTTHYWSLVYVPEQGWYHFDTTPRKGGGEFNLVTDAFLQDYSSKHKESHDFDTSKYPATPKEKVKK